MKPVRDSFFFRYGVDYTHLGKLGSENSWVIT
jgi:hypothetical protein